MPQVKSVGAEAVRVKSGSDTDILTALGVDWDAIVGPTDRSAALLAGADRLEEFDVSTLPINSVAIIRFAWCAFSTGALGGANTSNYGVILAIRDKDGLLTANISAWASIASSIGTDPLVGVTAITTPDNNTVRLKVTNGAQTTYWLFRFAISYLSSAVAVNPL
jgi:hypothetical protein